MEENVKEIEQNTELSIQSRAREEGVMYPGGLLLWMAHSGELIAPWWSRQRDTDLDQFVKHSDHVSGTMGLLQDKVASVPVRVLPRDTTVRSHWAQAEDYNIRLTEESDFGVGWIDTVSSWLADYWGTDNGGFFEIIGEDGKGRSIKAISMSQKERFQADIHVGPIVGPAQGIANLDSLRCTRTGNPEYPVIYQDTDGRLYKLHWSRVAFASSMPSNRAEMYKVGFCAVSRWLNYAQNLIDIGVHKQEKLGSRPRRAIVTGKRVKGDLIIQAMQIADEAADSAGFRRYAPTAVLGDLPSDAEIELLDLISLPDGFDEETSVRLGMFTGALAFGVPIRWIWPASSAGATKADAMFQHVAGLGGGIGKVLSTLTYLLGGDPRTSRHSHGKFLPSHLKLVFDYQDDQQDQARADIQQTRSKTWQVNLEAGTVDTRTVREQMLEAGDLTKAQFERLELQDGRLPDGMPVLSLFSSTDNRMLGLLDLGVPEPLAIDINDPMQMLFEIDTAALDAQDVLRNVTGSVLRQQAEQALAALGALKELYSPMVQQQVELEMVAEQGEMPEEEELEEEKAFNYGAQVGNVIAGRLARGEGGRFVNVEQLKAQLLAGIRARLAGRADGAGRQGAAASKRAENREAVAAKLGLDPAQLEAMQAMRQGEDADTSSLLSAGLAQVNDDGSVTMTSAGRSLLSAANSGDVDKAKSALAKSKEPPKGKKPKSKKPKVDRERQKREELARNREKVAGALEDTNLSTLLSFRDGELLDPDVAKQMAQDGLVEIGIDGEPRLTSAGRSVASAADKGDIRKAKDAVSRASEKVWRTVQRARKKDEQADDLDARAEKLADEAVEMQGLADEADAEADMLEMQLAQSEDEEEREKFATAIERQRDRAQRLRERAEQRSERSEQSRERAQELRDGADELIESVGGVPETPEEEPFEEREEKPRKKKSFLDLSRVKDNSLISVP